MGRRSGTFAAAMQYWGLMLAYGLLGCAPLWFAKRLARVLADLVRVIDSRHALRVEAAAKDRLGLDAAGAKRLAKENYRHYAYTAMEILRLARMPDEAALTRIRFGDGLDAVRSAKSEGRGIMLLTGHMGNWEWCGFTAGRYRLAEGVVARPLNNPRLDAFLRRIRERAGFEVWSKFGAIRRLFKTLSRGGGAGALVDQDGGPRGLPGFFLGRSCTTMSLPVEVAVKAGAPLVVGGVFRDREPMRFVVRLKRVRRPDPAADAEAEVRRLTQAVNDDLGDLIREFPEQWIWTHQRWRHGRSER
ncbi:MAG: lysophospholipid acyltransferase family protein [Planctomycetota bacterium]|jgi:KDO2-lipid IV(A) lauroyltransferase|nr:lysophospholipid acyltransferase family protein [Planctomycetota bacterium]